MQPFNSIYRGKVLATDALEADKVGRIKVEVYPMLIGVDTAKQMTAHKKALGLSTVITGVATDVLPWAIPAMSISSGAGSGYGSFAVPEVGSYVWVFFEAGDIYQPVYFAEAQTKTFGIPTEALTNYPSNKVIKTKNGIVIEINDGALSITVTHPQGSSVSINGSGNISIASAGTVSIESAGACTIKGGTVSIN